VPKIKTRRGAAKRFKTTGTGKIARARAFKRHKLTHKTSRQKRRLSGGGLVHPTDEARVRQQIPYL
jgi:large subunit ribosomal protein L35